MWSRVAEPTLFTMYGTIAQSDPWSFLGILLSNLMRLDSCSQWWMLTSLLLPPTGGDPEHLLGSES